jgi:hypothetical protein
MLMDLIPPSKGTVLQTGLKSKVQQFVAYRRHISSRNKHRLRMKGCKKNY